MIVGVGTDILKIQRIRDIYDDGSDPFFEKTYTEKEREQASVRPDPVLYFATRFAGKEAVFKTFGLHGHDIRLNEIEILGQETEQPKVFLSGRLGEIAEEKGVRNIQISLTYETEYAVAFAVAQA